MKHFTFVFTGDVTVSAENEEEALAKAEELTAFTAWQSDHAEDISIYEYKMTDSWEEEE